MCLAVNRAGTRQVGAPVRLRIGLNYMGVIMLAVVILKNDRNQAIRLPKEFQFEVVKEL